MKTVTLRALEPEDIDLIYRWENDERTWESSDTYAPFSRHQLTQYIMASMESDVYATRQLRLVAMDEERAVGCADLFDFNPFHRRAGMGILVDSASRGKGYGEALTHALGEYCRRQLQLHQLYCDVAADNAASISMLRRCGYEVIGVRREWLCVEGQWKDALSMQHILS
ncbi:MAG: GNAT family N-acetyltransferase [Bacteroidales bacterium]|nr:GNAT family N-acetyltransferase [Bacteroidales bacterium]